MIDVVEGCQSLFQNTLARVKEGVRDKLSHSGIDYSDVGELDSAFDLPSPSGISLGLQQLLGKEVHSIL